MQTQEEATTLDLVVAAVMVVAIAVVLMMAAGYVQMRWIDPPQAAPAAEPRFGGHLEQGPRPWPLGGPTTRERTK